MAVQSGEITAIASMQLPGLSWATLAASSLLAMAPALAQVESFLVGPGSSVGPSTKVKPKNCVTAADGSITCDTQLENSPSDTQARTIYEQFKN
ncbi:MAG: hypothetical protein CK549_04985 [Cyanobium sp. Baikal-G2]|nr:MAG: hypothetical protein CK549_04985 [Cyanobium sp. Baikal-G2]